MAAKRQKTRYPGVYRQGRSWQQVIYIDGKQRWISARTRAELKEKVQKEQVDATSGKYVPPSRQKVTVAEAVDAWLKAIESTVRPTTLRGYRSNARKVKAAIGGLPARSLTADTLTKLYADTLSTGVTRYVAVNMHAVIRDALSHADINSTAARDAKLPRRERREIVTLDSDGAARLLNAAEGTDIDHLISLTLRTGLRRSEVLGLRWGDVDLAAAELHVRRGLHVVKRQVVLEEPKSAASRRVVALSPSACLTLRRQWELMEERAARLGVELLPEHHVFVRPDFSPMLPDTVSHTFHKLVMRTGLNGLRFHDLRHSFATLMLGAGVHPKVVSDAMGHSDIRVTLNLYSHSGSDLHRKAMDALDAALEPGNAALTVEATT